ncbi:MAG: collagen-like protein [Candidatus Marinimicrobia bacterium]|nr:collagen-like protein [Candidatus Neomarinimicrobiota bacterium]MBT3848381.1 collagen-like protein [Candidatus Neomarinimicrobiota bacterium]MBT6982451.1 collagen-like protein [Candidatus Neomarinimicrobiota bacterium]
MKYFTSITTLLLLLTGCLPQGSAGPQGPPGKDGAKGLTGQGMTGPMGPAGSSIPADQLKKVEAFLSQNNESSNEHIVAIESYSFGLAPRITGFCFLTSHGRIFKMENKNVQVLGESISLVGRISNHYDFISLSRIAYGEDIKQYFVATTKSGMVFSTNDLKAWESQGDIPLK